MHVTSLKSTHLRVPLAKFNRLSLTDPKPYVPDFLDLVLVELETDKGLNGLGFTYLSGVGAPAIRSLIDSELSHFVAGEDPREVERLLSRAEGYYRTVGFAGLVARAYSAIDMALWDLK